MDLFLAWCYFIGKIMSRKIFLFFFFFLQLIGIIYARFTDVRYFCWAPYDQISTYQIQVRLPSRNFLSEDEIQSRYHIPAQGRENRAIHNIISLIEKYEKSYGKQEQAEVRPFYSTNGKKQNTWNYPK